MWMSVVRYVSLYVYVDMFSHGVCMHCFFNSSDVLMKKSCFSFFVCMLAVTVS